jgi:hypothetical protein
MLGDCAIDPYNVLFVPTLYAVFHRKAGGRDFRSILPAQGADDNKLVMISYNDAVATEVMEALNRAAC